jgi:hypothetical protein
MLLVLGVIPWTSRLFPESPKYHFMMGNFGQARDTLAHFALVNGVELLPAALFKEEAREMKR